MLTRLAIFEFFVILYKSIPLRNAGRNMLVRILWIKYIINTGSAFVLYLYIFDQINARRVEHIQIILYLSFRASQVYNI